MKNLLLLLKEFGDKKIYDQFARAEADKTIRYVELKQMLLEAYLKYFSDFREKRAELLKNKNKLEKIMADGAKKAQKIADKTMIDVRQMVGLR